MRVLITGAAGNLGSFLATGVEAFALVIGSTAPLHRDFIRIGMVSHVGDTSRMKQDLLPQLAYPSLDRGLSLLE